MLGGAYWGVVSGIVVFVLVGTGGWAVGSETVPTYYVTMNAKPVPTYYILLGEMRYQRMQST